MTGEITIDHPESGTVPTLLADEIREGLGRELKELSPKHFYDERGSRLFDRITTLPEYYPTRCERAILNRRAPEIVAASGARDLVELGSGTASKTRALLHAMAGAGTLRRYVPFDVDPSVIEASAAELVQAYPGLEVHGVVGDFGHDLHRIPPGDHRLFVFLGGTIGNLYPAERADFLGRLRDLMADGDRLLLGTDLVKDRDVLEAAYNDSAGVTAEFNRNVLRVLNRSLDADFDPQAFEHVAFWDPDSSRIEMRLRSTAAQTVRIARAELVVEFEAGEDLLTEISTKFTRAGIERELDAVGLRLEAFHTDDHEMFGVSVAAPA
jgi:L-histidine N-alpha-methyltransferase